MYTGKKEYDEQFSDRGSKNANKATTYTLTDLFPGTSYSFEVYGVYKCGNSLPLTLNVDTDISSKYFVVCFDFAINFCCCSRRADE